MAKIKKEEIKEEVVEMEKPTGMTPQKTEKEKLLDLYQTLKDLNIRSIGDLENLIARS